MKPSERIHERAAKLRKDRPGRNNTETTFDAILEYLDSLPPPPAAPDPDPVVQMEWGRAQFDAHGNMTEREGGTFTQETGDGDDEDGAFEWEQDKPCPHDGLGHHSWVRSCNECGEIHALPDLMGYQLITKRLVSENAALRTENESLARACDARGDTIRRLEKELGEAKGKLAAWEPGVRLAIATCGKDWSEKDYDGICAWNDSLSAEHRPGSEKA